MDHDFMRQLRMRKRMHLDDAIGRHHAKWKGRRGRRAFDVGDDVHIGRMLAHGDLRLVVLALLADEPRHGYEIIKALEERSSGVYSPSPGVVYPTLTYLEEAGYATAATDGNKRVYTITDDGRSHLDANREAADRVLTRMERFGRRLARVRAWEDWAEGGGDRPTLAELDRARRRLRMLIADAIEAGEDDQRRLADILNKAADEALAKT